MTATAQATFPRSYEALERIFEFSSGFFVQHRIDPRLLASVDFLLEELFTNMVKYANADDPARGILIDMAAVDGGVEVTLTDFGVDPFDVTQAPDAAVDRPIGERRPGGLGLHLTRRLVDSWDYEYSQERREARIRFRKTTAGRPVPAPMEMAKGT